MLPHPPFGTRGQGLTVESVELLQAILHKLKTGCQWCFLPVRHFFSHHALSWQGVYYSFNKWRKDGPWKRLWVNILRLNRHLLDLSSVPLDGSHTPAKNGGTTVGYQGRKAARTTNTLFLAGNTDQPLAGATPQAGNHHDLFAIEPLFAELCHVLEATQLALEGLSLNADSGFDAATLRQACFARDIEANIARNPRAGRHSTTDEPYFDEELYRRRVVIEHTNAWLDSFKTLLVRYETNVDNWLAFRWLAFVVLLLRKNYLKPQS